MIFLTKKNMERTRFALNHKMIEKLETSADTIVVMCDGKRIIVDESPEEIVVKMMEYEAEVIFRAQNKRM